MFNYIFLTMCLPWLNSDYVAWPALATERGSIGHRAGQHWPQRGAALATQWSCRQVCVEDKEFKLLNNALEMFHSNVCVLLKLQPKY